MARGHFAKSEKQAASVMKELQGKGNIIDSVGTARNYEQALKTCCDYLKEFKLGALRELTPEKTKTYLETRAQECSQKTVDMDRQALQTMMQHVTHELKETEKLDVVKSSLESIEASRSYT
ncbi:site-specific integrase, partial [Vibrio parahaemolyticus]